MWVGGTRFATMHCKEWGVVKNGEFGCYVITEWPKSGTLYLVQGTLYTSCLMSCRITYEKTYDITKLGNIWEILKNGWEQRLLPSIPFRNKTLVLVVKNYAKIDTKVSLSCPILLDFLTLFHKLHPWLSESNFFL